MYQSFSPDGVAVTTSHDPNPLKRMINGEASMQKGVPVTQHVTALPGNITEAAEQIASIVQGDRVIKVVDLPQALTVARSGL